MNDCNVVIITNEDRERSNAKANVVVWDQFLKSEDLIKQDGEIDVLRRECQKISVETNSGMLEII